MGRKSRKNLQLTLNVDKTDAMKFVLTAKLALI
jgi:hypothetical protein